MCMCAPNVCLNICKYIDMCGAGARLRCAQRAGNAALHDQCALLIYVCVYTYIYICVCVCVYM